MISEATAADLPAGNGPATVATWRLGPALAAALRRYLGFRLVLSVVAAVVFIRFGGSRGPDLLWRPWVQEDSYWYVAIAQSGYRPLLHVAVGPHVYNATEFSPALPALIGAVHTVTRLTEPLAGLLVTGLGAVAALVLLDAYGCQLGLSEAQRRWASLSVLLWPTAFFFNSIYTEPLQLSGLLLSLILARHRRYLLAGLAVAAAVLTKSLDIVFVAPLVASWWTDRERNFRQAVAAVAPPLLSLAGLACGFAALSGDPLDLLHAAAGWNHGLSPPWQSLWSGIQTVIWPVDGATQSAGRLLDFVGIAVLAWGCVIAWRRREAVHGALLIGLLAVFLLDGDIEGSARRLLIAFPLFLYAGEFLAARQPPQRLRLLVLPALLLVGFTAVFASGHLV